MYGDNVWPYITQKKKAEEALSQQHTLEKENKKLKEIVKKLIQKEPLTNEDKKTLKELGL